MTSDEVIAVLNRCIEAVGRGDVTSISFSADFEQETVNADISRDAMAVPEFKPTASGPMKPSFASPDEDTPHG